ncbi:protein kinase domain-containing protein [Candidatus Uabimicrobium amorphum]|uniref:Protein kinase n=1 Tax=Uabimicrobium amorphum TaxID=2596890 RepID=A0A5S9IIZ6_UABAM|nr:protein kinase [Candidatus Uabimicrobium amorphum]BBM82759.1 protein kinase [Candidatus Uabimicrobium amorphum]
MEILSGKYKVESTLGQGAMGKVYLVRNLRSGCYFAAKECNSLNPKILERIRREFYFLTRINHPNIVRGIEFLQQKNSYFIVMDYIQGVTVRDVLKKKLFTIDFNKKLEIATQICSAVATLNKAEIIHRDIKPSNIMLEGNNLVPRLLDLGIAKMESMQSLTQPGKVVGTPKYMSPEQVEGSIAHNSDVFSLGVVLYQWFAWMENSPFHDQSKARVFRNILQARLPLLHEFLGDRSPHVAYVARLLDQALHKDPQKRLSSTAEMYNILRNCPLAQPNQVVATSPPLSTTPASLPNPEPIDLESLDDEIQNSPSKIARRKNDDKIFDKNVIIIPLLLAGLILCGFFWIMSFDKTPPKKKTPKILRKKIQKSNTKKDKTPPKNHNKSNHGDDKSTNKRPETKEKEEVKKQSPKTTHNKMFAAHYKLGAQYMKLKHYSKALRHFTKAIKMDHRHADSFRSRGICFFYLAKYRRALRDFNRALKLEPSLEGELQSYIARSKKLKSERD